jgi:hypothetical protein
MEKKLKHLEFIQAVITRFNSNSFLIKGWAVTIVSAIFALAAKDANQHFIRVIYVAVPAFWLLDAFYLGKERQYRGLYNDACTKAEAQINFQMTPDKKHRNGRNTWIGSFFAPTLIIFYALLILLPIIIMMAIRFNLIN